MINREGSGMLDHPLTGAALRADRWRVVTAEFVEHACLTARPSKQRHVTRHRADLIS
jgi:hypothetical protein